MVSFDATFLLYLFDERAQPPKDPTTGLEVEKCAERIEYLIERLQESKERILVPTPALSEIMVGFSHQIPDMLARLSSGNLYRIADFDALAAVEVGFMAEQDGCNRSMRLGNETKAKCKYDRQIVAISKVEGVSAIYSDDAGLRKKAEQNGLKVIGVHELPLRPPQSQVAIDWSVADAD